MVFGMGSGIGRRSLIFELKGGGDTCRKGFWLDG